MIIKFDEDKLIALEYHWNIDKKYMFKQTESFKICGRKYRSAIIINANGFVEIDNASNLSDMFIEELKNNFELQEV